MSIPDLCFVRHGQTDWSVEGRFQGRSDIPLNDQGRDQARRLACCLRAHIGDQVPRMVTSPLRRARQTADLIAQEMGVDPADIALAESLTELSFGRWEGKTTAEIKRTDNPARRARKADRWTVAPPGGESYAAAAARVGDWLAAIESPAIVISHSGIMRVVWHLAGRIPTTEAATMPIPHDRILFAGGGTVRWL